MTLEETIIPTCLEGGHWKSGNLVFTPIEIHNKESVVAPHTHEAGHNILILQGSFLIKTFDPSCQCRREEIFKAFSHCWIPAGIEHEAIPLEDHCKGVCIFVNGEFDFKVDKVNNGWGDKGDFTIERK